MTDTTTFVEAASFTMPADCRSGPADRITDRERRRHGRRRLPPYVLVLFLVFMLLASSRAGAQQAGTLTVTATVSPAIQVVFVNAVGASETTVGYCPVTSSGTANIGLDFGTCSRNTGCSRSCVLFARLAAGGGNPYTAESRFDLVVVTANSTSGSYNVQAWLGTAPPPEVTYSVNGVQLSTTAQLLGGQATNPYGIRISQDLMLRVRNNLAAQTVNQTIHYLATSN